MSEQIQLSISLLASNRPDSIRKCLDSLKPVMEQIPSELIIVDTSGSESMHQILLEYTDQVIPFEWCNDFSKARNTGLKRAKGEWFLFLDDDEWFVEIGPLVHFFKSGEYRDYSCANYIVRNFYDRAYQNYSDSWASRMVKLEPQTEFRSKIHEYLYPAEGRCKALSAIAYHSGYIFDTQEERRKHFERNASLLEEMMKEEPDNLRWKVQLAQEYRSIKDWEKLREFCEKALEETRDRNSRYDNLDVGTFYGGRMESLLFLKRYDEALRAGQEALDDTRNSPLCRAYIHLCFAVVYLRKGDLENAQNYAHKYLRAGRQLRKDPVELEDEKTALLIGEALDGVPMKRAYSILIYCGLKQKDLKPLKKYLKDLEWEGKVIYVLDGLVEMIVDADAQMEMDEILVQASQLLWNNGESQPKFFKRIQDWTDQPEAFRRLLSVVARLESSHWYIYYARVRLAGWNGEADRVGKELKDFFRHSTNVFMTPDEITGIAAKYHVDTEELYLSVPFDQWRQQLDEYISKITLNDLLITEREFHERKTRESIYYDFLFLRIAEAKAVSIATQDEVNRKRLWLLQFADFAGQYCTRYYQQRVMEDYPEILPEDLQASLHVARGLEKEKDNFLEALKEYKAAIEVCPSFAEGLQNYIHALQEQKRRQEQEAEEELRHLRDEVMSRAEKMLESGKPAEAYEILQELKKMQPDDLETAQLILKARLVMLEQCG